MTFAEEAIKDLAEIIADLPIQIEWPAGSGNLYTAARGELNDAQHLNAAGGGFLHDYVFSIIIGLKTLDANNLLQTTFPGNPPQLDDKVIVDGTAYRIGHIITDEFGAGWQLALATAAL